MITNNYRVWILVIYISAILFLSFNSIIFFNNQWKYDVYIHFFEYLILGFLLVNAILPYGGRYYSPVIILIILIPIIDESIQYFIPGRISSLKHILVDIFGGAFGSYIRYLILNKFNI